MKRITELVKSGKLLVSDGAWGTRLQELGLTAGECAEVWNELHRDRVLSVATSYVSAGANLIETNSFGGSRIKLASYQLQDKTAQLNKTAAEISREATGKNVLVLGSIGPTGKFLITGGITKSELIDAFREQAVALRDGGADALCLETFYDLDEARCAVMAARENTDLEIICTFTFDKKPDGSFKTMMGIDPKTIADTVLSWNVDIIGTNCGNGFADMVPIIAEMRSVNPDIPILVQANAGLPKMDGEKILYPETPDTVAEIVPQLVKAGANIIGGCCGTTQAHISEIRKTLLQHFPDKLYTANN
jgi:5-methyltetrahydrofolate--homocysteine methyltransferase